MTGTPIPPDIITTTSGLEYTLSRDGNPWPPCENPPCTPNFGSAFPLTWSDVTFTNLPEPVTLNNFNVMVRYYVETQTTNGVTGDTTVTRAYPAWTLVEQTLIRFEPNHSPFVNPDEENLWVATPEQVANNFTAYAGIHDGRQYSYPAVFDQSDIRYLPRCSPNKQKFISQPQNIPSDPDEYPIDAICSFLPDEREEVVVKYRLTTKYDSGLGEVTDSVVINHPCLQEIGDIGNKLKSYLNKCYFTHGKYHNQLYELDQEPLYDNKGNLIREDELREPEYNGTELINTVSDFTLPTQTEQTIPTEVRRPDD